MVGAVKTALALGPGHSVVTVLCDGGERYLGRTYQVGGRGGWAGGREGGREGRRDTCFIQTLPHLLHICAQADYLQARGLLPEEEDEAVSSSSALSLTNINSSKSSSSSSSDSGSMGHSKLVIDGVYFPSKAVMARRRKEGGREGGREGDALLDLPEKKRDRRSRLYSE